MYTVNVIRSDPVDLNLRHICRTQLAALLLPKHERSPFRSRLRDSIPVQRYEFNSFMFVYALALMPMATRMVGLESAPFPPFDSSTMVAPSRRLLAC